MMETCIEEIKSKQYNTNQRIGILRLSLSLIDLHKLIEVFQSPLFMRRIRLSLRKDKLL